MGSLIGLHKGHFISYLKARNLVSKGCVYHLVQVNDCSVLIPPIQSVLVVKEFPEDFPNDLLGVNPEIDRLRYRSSSRYSSYLCSSIYDGTERVETTFERSVR